MTTNASASQRSVDTVPRPRSSVVATSRPSDSSSNFDSNGLPSSTIVIWAANFGSWCSIRREPLCAAGATIGLSVEACRFNFHSPEKSGFSCAMTVVAPAR